MAPWGARLLRRTDAETAVKMSDDWVRQFKQIVEKKPLVVMQFSGEEWERLRHSRRGVNEFTLARSHDVVGDLKTPTACLIFGKNAYSDEGEAYIGQVSSRQAVTTLESRVKVKRVVRISPNSPQALLQLVTESPHAGNLRRRFGANSDIVVLSPKLSGYIIEQLAAIEGNRGPMRAASASLSSPNRYQRMGAMQEDAVHTALRAFGLSSDDRAVSMELGSGQETALARINILEDAVVEHDARYVPGYDLVHSDVTGHAVFEKGMERLDVFTANRRDLEHAFGVDLIYLNRPKKNVVMVQYKMLEAVRCEDKNTDWIYRPDANLNSEIKRMRAFARVNRPGEFEYRLNSEVFYLKFVKRDGALHNSGIIMPIDHFETTRSAPDCRGPKGGIRLSYDALEGRYLRQGPFLDLVRSGYIGAHAETTAHLTTLIAKICFATSQPRGRTTT